MRDLPPPTSSEPSKARRVYIRNSVELARYGYLPGCIGCEAAMTQGLSRDHTEQCRARIITAMSFPPPRGHRLALDSLSFIVDNIKA